MTGHCPRCRSIMIRSYMTDDGEVVCDDCINDEMKMQKYLTNEGGEDMSKLSVFMMFVAKKQKLQQQIDAINVKLSELLGEQVFDGEQKPKRRGGWHWTYAQRKRLSESMRARHARLKR